VATSLGCWRGVVLMLAALSTGTLAAEGRRVDDGRQTPRLLVLTDITSVTAGVREPDDGQSLARLMLYTTEVEIEGLIASSNLGHGQVVRPELIREVIRAYGRVRPNLLLHDARYPPPERLLACVKAGQPVAERKASVWDSIGEGKDTEGSEWIAAVVDRPDPRPVWVAVWGGTADLAQALWKVRQTRSPAAAARFVSRLRIHAINDQDSTAAWIKAEFPGLFYITRTFGMRGMYRGGDRSLVSPEWVETHARNGHGPLGALYPNYNGGDIWSRTLGPVRGIKEGDTPSLLPFIDNGLRDLETPSWGSWGGRCEQAAPNRFVDARDEVPGMEADPDPRMSAVYRWRPAYQADFQARLDWCVKPYSEANHPPVARVRGALRRTVKPGAEVTLDARASSDPDGHPLSFRWSLYREAGTYAGPLILEEPEAPRMRFRTPTVSSRETLHLVLTVQDRGEPPLSRYQRVVITVDPG